jgi:hypothetical protein
MTKKKPKSKGDMREKSSNTLEKFNWMAIVYIYTTLFKTTFWEKVGPKNNFFRKGSSEAGWAKKQLF